MDDSRRMGFTQAIGDLYDDVRMAESRGGIGFLHEPLLTHRVGDFVMRENLEIHNLIVN